MTAFSIRRSSTLAILYALTALSQPAAAEGIAFEWVQRGDVVQDGGVSAGLAWGDYDDDGRPDLVVANSGQPDFLYRNRGEAGFERVTEASWTAVQERSHGVSLADYDDDGDLDLFVATYAPTPNLLYRNEGEGRLISV